MAKKRRVTELATVPTNIQKWIQLRAGETLPDSFEKIDANQLEELASKFVPVYESMANAIKMAQDVVVKDEQDKANMKLAERLRKSIKADRIKLEALRKSEKAFVLLAGKAVDYFGNTPQSLAKEEEAKLLYMENTAKRAQAERDYKLNQERLAVLQQINPDFAAESLFAYSEEEFEELRQNMAQAKKDAEELAAHRAKEEEEKEAARLATEQENARLKAKLAALEAKQQPEPPQSGPSDQPDSDEVPIVVSHEKITGTRTVMRYESTGEEYTVTSIGESVSFKDSDGMPLGDDLVGLLASAWAAFLITTTEA